jgi:hypothetical protein
MQGQTEPIEWYLARDGKQHGPLSDLELGKFIELGQLRPSDLVWREGFADWQAASAAFPHVFAPPAPALRMPAPMAADRPAAPMLGPARSEPTLDEPMARGHAGPGPSDLTAPPEEAPDRVTLREQRRAERRAARQSEAAAAQGDRPDEEVSIGEPRLPEGYHEEEDEPPRRRGRGGVLRMAMVVVVLAATLGAGGWLLVSKRLELMTALGLAPAKATRAALATPPPQKVASAGPRSDAGSNAPPPARAEARDGTTPDAAPFSAEETAVDRRLQSDAVWQLVKGEFADAYRAHVAKVAKLEGEGADAQALLVANIEMLVTLRRKHQALALGASLPRLKAIAATFLASLTHLGSKDGEACFGFISQGETAKSVVPLLSRAETGKVVLQQFAAVLEAAVEGRRSPRAWPGPRQSDYDTLAQELGTRGWKEADMQLFADPRALAREPAPRVCKMLGDWFAAQLAVRDPDVQLRLLVDALRPVVAG